MDTTPLELRPPVAQPDSLDPTEIEVDTPQGWVILGGRVIQMHWIEDLERALSGGTIVRMQSGRTVHDTRPIDEVASVIVEAQIA